MPFADPSRRPARRTAAFTLVELLVVIGIVALLISILLPALSAARQQANAVACLSNVRQIATAADMYAQDHKRYVSFVPAVGPQPAKDRKELLFPYLRQGEDNADQTIRQVWNCPANAQPHRQAGYGFNVKLNGIRITKVRRPSETVALCDAGLADVPTPAGIEGLATHCWPPGRPSSASACRPNHLRHPKELVTVGFVDGHGERLPFAPPFYPGPIGSYVPNNLPETSVDDPAYLDRLWDLK